jgi:hypothetical protein
MTTRPRAQRSRRWRIVAAAIAPSAPRLGFVHLPFVRTDVLSWVVAELAHRGIRFEAASATTHYADGRLRDDGRSGQGAHSSRRTLSGSICRSLRSSAPRCRVDEVDRPRVRLVQSADGSWNLPRSTNQDHAGPWLRQPLRIDRLIITGLAVQYSDASGIELESAGVNLALQRTPAAARG